MTPALWAAKTGLDAQQTRMGAIAHNLANVNTTGYKAGHTIFEDLLYQNVRQAGALSSQETQLPTGLQLGTGVRVVATEKSFAQGSIVQTGRDLDVAIEGRGFFEIILPDGNTGYTRDGSFKRDNTGQVVTASGYQLQPGIQLPDGAQTVTVGRDGTVSVQLNDQAAPVQVGTVTLVDFINPAGLQARGENLFLETGASGPPSQGTAGQNGLGLLLQSNLEGSNVNIVEELVNMIETQRAYEMNSRAISTNDQMLQFITNNV